MLSRQSLPSVLTTLGAGIVTLGAVLPWFGIDPRYDPLYPPSETFPTLHPMALEGGIQGPEVGLVLGAAIVVVTAVGWPNRPTGAILTALIGVGTLSLPLLALMTSPLVGFGEALYPITGWFLTLGGGLLMTAGGLTRWGGLQDLKDSTGNPDRV